VTKVTRRQISAIHNIYSIYTARDVKKGLCLMCVYLYIYTYIVPTTNFSYCIYNIYIYDTTKAVLTLESRCSRRRTVYSSSNTMSCIYILYIGTYIYIPIVRSSNTYYTRHYASYIIYNIILYIHAYTKHLRDPHK